MYLLNTETFTLHYFSEPRIPDYAILSHTWNEVEISFTEMKTNKNIQEAAAFSKIRGCCTQARADGFEYVWIDSCCIDKSSSSELLEAVNSMFLWYAKAQMCYAYLSDVPAAKAPGGLPAPFAEAAFRKSRWFTRGWTLQELIAPDFVTFYDQDWQEICTKRSLPQLLVSITGIRYEILTGSLPVSDASIAERMSWASKRVTSRTEDVAYCLLGIFGVNIPPLYGEGQNAFLRLQQEIIRTTNDETIFAWTIDTADTLDFQGGLLASSPAAFRYSGNVQRSNFDGDRPPYQMTNKGLCLDLLLFSPGEDSEDYLQAGDLIAVLNCSRNNNDDLLAIFLQNTSAEQYVRVKPEALPGWGRGMGLELGRTLVYVPQPSSARPVFQREHCTLLLQLKWLGHSPMVEIDPAKNIIIERDSRVSNLEGSLRQVNFKVFAKSDGRMYLALQILPFLLLLNFSEKPFGANVATETYQFGDVDCDTYCGEEFLSSDLRHCTFDRLSRASISSYGISMSVTFKRGATRGNDGAQHFVVDVTLDPKRRLPWPDPNEMRPENQRLRATYSDF